MKTLQLKINDQLYDTLLAMLKGLPKTDIEIIETNEAMNVSLDKGKPKVLDIMQYAGTIKWPVDGVK